MAWPTMSVQHSRINFPSEDISCILEITYSSLHMNISRNNLQNVHRWISIVSVLSSSVRSVYRYWHAGLWVLILLTLTLNFSNRKYAYNGFLCSGCFLNDSTLNARCSYNYSMWITEKCGEIAQKNQRSKLPF